MSPELQELKELVQAQLADAEDGYKLRINLFDNDDDKLICLSIITTARSFTEKVLKGIDEIAARSKPVPFVSKGKWVRELLSDNPISYVYRCTRCFERTLLQEERRCSCDDQPEG